MKMLRFIKPNKYNLIISTLVAVITAYLANPYILEYYSNFSYCMAIGCPTENSMTGSATVKLFVLMFIAVYLIMCFFTNRKK